MTWLAYLICLLGLSWAGVGIYRSYAIGRGLMDHPGARTSHFVPTARGGGLIFSFLWFVVIGFLYYHQWTTQYYLYLWLPVLIVALMGFWEDNKGLSATKRLLIQAMCAAGALTIIGEHGQLLYTLLPEMAFLKSWPLPVFFGALVFVIVWMTNVFNFMDGSDGIAAIQGIFIFGIGGYLLFEYQAIELGFLSWSLVALLAGFLIWNWPTAKIFMGDCGSYFLGFLTAIYAIVSIKYYQMPWIIWVLLTGPFWFDATITLLRRMVARQPWREPHRLHAYQRLIQAGWSHQQVLLSFVVLNSILTGLVFLACHDPRLMHFALGLAIVLMSCLYLGVEIIKPMLKTWHREHNDIPAPLNLDP